LDEEDEDDWDEADEFDSSGPLIDDELQFEDIHVEQYLKKHGKKEFSSALEIHLVLETIREKWTRDFELDWGTYEDMPEKEGSKSIRRRDRLFTNPFTIGKQPEVEPRDQNSFPPLNY